MARTPYFLIAKVSLSANSTGEITVRTDANETLYLHEIGFNSTGNFEVIDWEDSRGNSFSNADSTTPIAQDLVPLKQTAYDSLFKLPEPIVIEPASVHTITVKDTSGSSNTVRFFAVGIRELR